MCVCLWLYNCGTQYSTESSDNLHSYPPDNHHSSDDVCWREGGSSSWSRGRPKSTGRLDSSLTAGTGTGTRYYLSVLGHCWLGTEWWTIRFQQFEPGVRPHSHWHEYDSVFPYGLFVRVKLVRVEHSQPLVQAQTRIIQSPLKIWWKLWNTLNFLRKFTPLSPIMLYVPFDVKIVSYMLYKYVTLVWVA